MDTMTYCFMQQYLGLDYIWRQKVQCCAVTVIK